MTFIMTEYFFHIVYFFLIDSYGALHLTLGLVGQHSVVVSIRAVTDFLYSSFGVCFLKSIKVISNNYRIFIVK